jgi:hypothetical protein
MSLQMSAEPRSVSESLNEQRDKRALLQAYHGAGRMGLPWNRRGPERVSDCAMGISDAPSHQQVTEIERATVQKRATPNNQAKPGRRRRANSKKRLKERSLTMRPW